jgi:pantoate--beta-alanine ligase
MMRVVKTVEEVRAIRRELEGTWGLVPTMGALHKAHLSLVRRAWAENDHVGVSIFVNPTQFGPGEDLEAYPRDLDGDCARLKAEGVDLVWAPTPEEMYPPGFQTWVTVEEVTRPLEGAARPGHFRGVATVVAKLFNVFEPDRAYFGQKDAQQVVVVRQMVHDLNFNLEVVVCPTVREPDGLAMSSRNSYLKPDERKAATVLYRALSAGREAWMAGERDGDALRRAMQAVLDAEPLAHTQYTSAADPQTLIEIEGQAGNGALLSMAVSIGKTRLIDNILLGGEPE